MTSHEILSYNSPEGLFPNNAADARLLFSRLAKIHHPDYSSCPEAAMVFSRLKQLHDEAQVRIKEGRYGFEKVVEIKGVVRSVIKSTPCELGELNIGSNFIYYQVSEEFQELRTGFMTNVYGLNYHDARMERDAKRYFPARMSLAEPNILVIGKSTDLIRLRDVLNYYGSAIPPKTAAWIISSLYNLLCYFSFSGISHNAITVDNYYINPKDHSGALLGGWWYATGLGKRISQLPQDTYDLLPFTTKTRKLGSRLIDVICVREIIGEIFDVDAPDPIWEWQEADCKKDAIENYRGWDEVLKKSFGPKKFTKMKETPEDIYYGIRKI